MNLSTTCFRATKHSSKQEKLNEYSCCYLYNTNTFRKTVQSDEKQPFAESAWLLKFLHPPELFFHHQQMIECNLLFIPNLRNT